MGEFVHLASELMILIIRMLSLADILRLSQTCRRMYKLAHEFIPRGHRVSITPNTWRFVERLASWPRLSIDLKLDLECLRRHQDLSQICNLVRTIECDRGTFEALRAQLQGKTFENIVEGRLRWDIPLEVPELHNMKTLQLYCESNEFPLMIPTIETYGLDKFPRLTTLHLYGCGNFDEIKGSALITLRHLRVVRSTLTLIEDFSQCETVDVINCCVLGIRRIEAKTVLLRNIWVQDIEDINADTILLQISLSICKMEPNGYMNAISRIRGGYVEFLGLDMDEGERFHNPNSTELEVVAAFGIARDIVASELRFRHVGFNTVENCSCEQLTVEASRISNIETLNAESVSLSQSECADVGDILHML